MKPEITLPATRFSQRFSSTPRGARLARISAVQQLAAWGRPHGGEVSEAVALVVAELAANAVRHGRVPGRDFGLRLTLADEPGPPFLRIEVSDARGESAPGPTAGAADPDEESGRGLLLVAAVAARWGVEPRVPVGKTVWAELPLAGG
ncbi:ATP-binding protein [Streptomyces sp. NPDC048639]|uniref:ATP-binding protein n=1 Tax=Streptomyces sp. NPDC048639 TaxID=3365581 RepID=UPI003722BD69